MTADILAVKRRPCSGLEIAPVGGIEIGKAGHRFIKRHELRAVEYPKKFRHFSYMAPGESQYFYSLHTAYLQVGSSA
jgi:hypothetical protein